MHERQKEVSQDPKAILQTAIEELYTFTQTEASRLEVGEDGRLIAAKESRLERMVGLARCYIGPLFSDQVRKEQEKRLLKLKKAILRARDIIQSHSALIAKFKEGDEVQRKLADSALLAIQRYNAIVAQDPSHATKPEIYNYERQRLLLDQEIKGQQIELPHVISIKYDSHPDAHPAHKMLQELSQALRSGAAKKNSSSPSPTHKKNLQFMIDAFHMKAIRMIEMHLQKPVAEIVPLVKKAIPEIDEESNPELITMQQFIKMDEGSLILVTGCFKRNISHSKFMTMPILDDLRLSFQMTHTGFPYPSQHTGWALSDHWVDAFPLRTDRTPLFQQIYQRRKRLAHQLLFDQAFVQKASRHFKIKRDIFDQNRHIFLSLHRQLQQALQKEALNEEESLLEIFYQEAACAPSTFDFLVQTQQQILNVFIKQPIRALEEDWLGDLSASLRIGSPQEKFQAACLRLGQHRQQAQEKFDSNHSQQAYLVQQGMLLSRAFQSVGLQYQSEKMGFSPPLLSDFERKLQACAFQQLITFLEECEQRLDILDPAQIKNDLLLAWSKDLALLETHGEDEPALPWAIVNELESYFNARFYSPLYEEEIK
jgi:hypothetical protein